MSDIQNRLKKIEAQLYLEQNTPTFEEDCAACAWYADALEVLDSDGELEPKDKAIWDDIFINKMDATLAWKKGQASQQAEAIQL